VIAASWELSTNAGIDRLSAIHDCRNVGVDVFPEREEIVVGQVNQEFLNDEKRLYLARAQRQK